MRTQADEMLRSLAKRASSEVGMLHLLRMPFYVKLCEAKVKAPSDAETLPGICVPFGLWRRLLKSPALQCSRGGRMFTWETVF